MTDTTRLPRHFLVLAALAVALPAGAAAADDAAFAPHYDGAMELVRNKDFRGAIREFELAYSARPDPRALFNIGLAYRLLALQGAPGTPATTEDAQRAMDNFGLYLDRHRAAHQSDPNDTRTVERYQDELTAKFGVKRVEKAKADPPPAPPAEPASSHVRRRWLLGGTLLGVGMAATAVGVGLLVASTSDAKAPDIATSGDFESRASTFGIAGGVLAGVGAAALVGGVVALIVPEKRADASALRILPIPGGLAVGGRF